MNPISYLTANLVARPVGYHMTRGWMQGDDATQDLFRPVERFGERFDEMLEDIRSLGFSTIDLWCAHLHPAWATDRHLHEARQLLDRHKMKVTAYPCHWGSTLEDLRQIKRVLDALGTDLISGGHALLSTDRPALVRELRNLHLRLAYENHPETSAEGILKKVGEGDEDVLGVAYDTGWAVTNGFDAAEGLAVLQPRLFHLHAKDVRARRREATGYSLIDMGHETCALGDGLARIETVVKHAVSHGFTGPIGIEHEPEDHDPAEECRLSLERLQQWLQPR